jgi:hypothetical protein
MTQPLPFYAGTRITAQALDNAVPLILSASNDQLFDTTSGVAIPGLSVAVAAAKYRIWGCICLTTSSGAGNAEVNFAAPATSTARLKGRWEQPGGGNQEVLPETVTSLATVFESYGLSASQEQSFEFDGTVTFSAAGTLTMQALCTSGADTFTVLGEGTYLGIQLVTS